MGRRVRKLVYARDPNAGDWSATPELDRRFVYYNWLPVVEYEGADNAKVRKYVWGLDLAGRDQNPSRERGAQIDAAGGTLDGPAAGQRQVGGMIAMRDVASGTNCICLYDAALDTCLSGRDPGCCATGGRSELGARQGWGCNLAQLMDGSLDARYEYDPYGTVIGPDEDGDGDWRDDASPFAVENPIRFSTKYWDDETGLGYWGYRYYSPRLGRWLSRDPMEELGGVNLYEYVDNAPCSLVDLLGLQAARPASNDCSCNNQIGTWSASLTDAAMLTVNKALRGRIFGTPDVLASTFRATYTLEDECWKCCCRRLGIVQVACDRLSDTGKYKCRLDQASGQRPYYSKNSVSTSTTVTIQDTPGFKHTSKLEQHFVTCAVCEKSNGPRVVLSCLKWGHKFHRNSTQLLTRRDGTRKKYIVYSAHRWLQDDYVWGWHAIPEDARVGDVPFRGTGPDGQDWMSPIPGAYHGPGALSPKGLDPVVEFFEHAEGVTECQ